MLLAIKRKDGGVSIMQIVPQVIEVENRAMGTTDNGDGTFTDTETITYENQTVMPKAADEIEKWKAAHTNPKTGICEYQSHKEITADDIPQDRYFRDAWKADKNSIGIDLEKAREIHLDNIRVVRDKALDELDIETLKGKDVQDQKQVLRDIPQTLASDLENAKTPDAIKEVWPEGLEK